MLLLSPMPTMAPTAAPLATLPDIDGLSPIGNPPAGPTRLLPADAEASSASGGPLSPLGCHTSTGLSSRTVRPELLLRLEYEPDLYNDRRFDLKLNCHQMKI